MTGLATTARHRLHKRALERYGYITTRDANELGITLNTLHALVHRGGITRVAQGVYRFDDVPVTERDTYMEAVLSVGEGAFLVADAVLALHNLALVNPPHLRVGTQRRRYRTLPATIEMVVAHIRTEDLTIYEAIPCTTVARALTDCVGSVMTERLLEAAGEAARRGLLRRNEAARVLEQLGRQE